MFLNISLALLSHFDQGTLHNKSTQRAFYALLIPQDLYYIAQIIS